MIRLPGFRLNALWWEPDTWRLIREDNEHKTISWNDARQQILHDVSWWHDFLDLTLWPLGKDPLWWQMSLLDPIYIGSNPNGTYFGGPACRKMPNRCRDIAWSSCCPRTNWEIMCMICSWSGRILRWKMIEKWYSHPKSTWVGWYDEHLLKPSSACMHCFHTKICCFS